MQLARLHKNSKNPDQLFSSKEITGETVQEVVDT